MATLQCVFIALLLRPHETVSLAYNKKIIFFEMEMDTDVVENYMNTSYYRKTKTQCGIECIQNDKCFASTFIEDRFICKLFQAPVTFVTAKGVTTLFKRDAQVSSTSSTVSDEVVSLTSTFSNVVLTSSTDPGVESSSLLTTELTTFTITSDAAFNTDPTSMSVNGNRTVNCGTPGYTLDLSYNVCYKVVEYPELSVINAKANCTADGAHLLLVDSEAMYQFMVEQIDTYSLMPIYIQGKRADKSSPFLDDNGNIMNYFNWDDGEPKINYIQYLRTNKHANKMEVSSGSVERPYICQIY